MGRKEKAPGNGQMFRSVRTDEGILSQQVAEQIQLLLSKGELRPGDRLPSERELGEQLGVSRTVVREAIKLLKATGRLRVRIGIGTYVAEPSQNILESAMSYMRDSDSKKIQDLLQVRSLLEPAIAASAAQNATAENIAKMEQAIQDMEQNISDGYRYIEADNVFHIALSEASNNSVFQLLNNSIVDLLQESRRLAISNPGAAKRANNFHRRILQAVKERDVNEAALAMKGHMRQAAEEVWATVKKQPLSSN